MSKQRTEMIFFCCSGVVDGEDVGEISSGRSISIAFRETEICSRDQIGFCAMYELYGPGLEDLFNTLDPSLRSMDKPGAYYVCVDFDSDDVAENGYDHLSMMFPVPAEDKDILDAVRQKNGWKIP